MRGLAALFAVMVFALTTGPGAWAQGSDLRTSDPSVRLVVSHLDPFVGSGSVLESEDQEPDTDLNLRVLVENDGEVEIGNLRLVIEVFARIGERSTLHAVLDGGSVPTRKLLTRDVRLREGEDLAAGDVTAHEFVLEEGDAPWTGLRGGVYPLQISVVQGTEVLDDVVTTVIFLDEPPASGRLASTVVWPLDDEPWRDSLGRYPVGVAQGITRGGRLERILSAVEEQPDAPVMLAPAAHLLEALADRADGFVEVEPDGSERVIPADAPSARRAEDFLRRLRELVATLPLEPLAAPYADAALAGMMTGPPPVPDMAAASVDRGAIQIAGLLDRSPSTDAAVTWTGLSREALDLFADRHLLLGFDDVVGPDLEENPFVALPPPVRELRSASGEIVTATIADPFVTAALTDPPERHGVPVATQQVLAETAMTYFEFPERTGRSLLVRPPADWEPALGGRFIAAVAKHLTSAPWLDVSTPAPHTPDEESTLARLTEPALPLPEELVDALAATRQRLAAIRDAVPEETAIGGRSYEALVAQLLRAPSRWLVEDGESAAMVAAVSAAVEQAVGEIEVSDVSSITLTSETGNIPVTVRRASGGPLSVQITVDSGGGLSWPEGRTTETLRLDPNSSETVSFRTRAVSRGTFPVTVTVTDPSGNLVFEEQDLSVRATAISGPALLGTGGVVLALIIVGLLRRRSNSKPQLEVVE